MRESLEKSARLYFRASSSAARERSMKRSRSIMRAGPQRPAQKSQPQQHQHGSPSAHLAGSLLSQRTGTARVTSAYQRLDDTTHAN